jgi:hypothetical protein
MEQVWIFSASGWLFKNKSITMHGNMNVNFAIFFMYQSFITGVHMVTSSFIYCWTKDVMTSQLGSLLLCNDHDFRASQVVSRIQMVKEMLLIFVLFEVGNGISNL